MATNNLVIRPATPADLERMNAIFNSYVSSTVMFRDQPLTSDERATWFVQRHGKFPVLVASLEGNIVGWASAAPYYKPAAGHCTVEDSIYVDHTFHRRGIGRALLKELVRQVQGLGCHSIVAEIHDQPPSILLHRELGFKDAGCIREAGFKLGRWIDVTLMQLVFTE
jgi:L-amino acid N-acyltransferase